MEPSQNYSNRITGKRLLKLTGIVFCLSLAIPSTLRAEPNRCEGLVQVGEGDWSIIIGRYDSPVCRFWTYSTLGYRIFAECPDSSMCSIALLSNREPGAEHRSTKTIVDVSSIQRIEK
jgi:hypothetical protein